MRNISEVLPILCRSNISMATTFFSMLSLFEFIALLYTNEKKNMYIYIFFIIVSNSKTYINEMKKAKSPLEKFIALYVMYKYFIFCILFFSNLIFSHDKREKQKWVNNDDRFFSMIEILERFRKFEASRVALFADISVSMSNL